MPRRFVLSFLGACAAFGVVAGVYFAHPKPFFFRAWEYFSLFVYEGYGERSQAFRESGDSARRFLFQKFISDNRVSVNGLGNRVACFEERPDARPRVLLVGDSQLFGSGTGDEGTFPSQLCGLFPAAIYNGARRHGVDLLRHPDYRFDAIVFTQTEGTLAPGDCEWSPGDLARTLAEGGPHESYLLPDERSRRPLTEQFQAGLKHLSGVIMAKFRSVVAGRWHAPEKHLDITAPHRVAGPEGVAKSLQCAKKVEEFFAPRGFKVGFLVFPAHQSIYAAELGVTLDEATSGFIGELTAAMTAAGMRTFDTRQCLLAARKQGVVFHPHDSHLNALGYRALAECLAQSSLAPLFR